MPNRKLVFGLACAAASCAASAQAQDAASAPTAAASAQVKADLQPAAVDAQDVGTQVQYVVVAAPR